MFYKIAKILSKTAIVFGLMCMVGGCSVEQVFFCVLQKRWSKISGITGTGQDSGKGYVEVFFILV